MEGEKNNGQSTRSKTERAIVRARQALGGNPAGSDPGGKTPGANPNPGENSGGDGINKDSRIEILGGSPNPSIVGGSGSQNPVVGSQSRSARERANERRTRVRNSGNGETGEGTRGESGGGQGRNNPGGNNPGGNPPTSTEEENETLLSFPPEAYFSDGRLKKSWAEKLNGSKKNPNPAPSALVKKKGISFLGDKELFSQVVEGIQYFFQALDLGAEYGLGVADVWELDENEAAVFARILLKRADKGDKKAIKTIATISENMDLVQAAMIVIPRMGVTIKEVRENGISPKINSKRSGKNSPKNSGDNPAGV